jgi:hypothetical protein
MNAQQQVVYRVRPDGVVWRAAGEETVLLDTESSVYFGLDRGGSLLWRHLAEGATVAELVAALVATAPAERVRAAGDVADFVNALLHHGLIQRG